MSSFQIVNGYVCFNCSQVALAQKGINPANPPTVAGGPPSQANGDAGSVAGSSNTQSTPAIIFGGSLSQTQPAAAVQPTTASSATATTFQTPPGQNGAQLNLYA
jgi:hypothetical protein